MMTLQDGHSSTKSNRRASRSLSRDALSTGAALVLGLFTALVAPKTALADEPAAPPASAAPAPAAEPARATPAAAPSRPLPPSILGMPGHDVVPRLLDGARLDGDLISASPRCFELRRPSGATTTAELQSFHPRAYSLDGTVPVANITLLSALTGGSWLAADLCLDMNAGQGEARFVAGPGIRIAPISTRGYEVNALRVPFQIGLESLSKKRTFGLKLLARPWRAIADESYSSTTGGGLLGALVFSGYALSDRGAR